MRVLAALAALAASVSAGPSSSPLAYPADCLPGAVTRQCTTFEVSPCLCPGQGNQKRFALTISYHNVAGLLAAPRRLIGANGTSPGPAIVVDQGDWVIVAVTNALDVPSTVHWHGMLHVGTPSMDGVPGITQCFIPPGGSLEYSFRASLAGTYWYHGHALEQYVDGLYGPLIIRPPPHAAAPAAYDDEATLMISDYYNQPAHDLLSSYYLTPASGGNEPIPDAIVVNGAFSGTLGLRARRGRRLRLRVIAANAFSMFTVSVDGLPLLVIEVDGTSVAPYEVSSFTVNVAQRVSVVLDFSLLPPNLHSVWVRVTAMADMYPVDITGFVPPYETAVPGVVPLNPNYLAWISLAPDGAAPTYTAPLPPPRAEPAAETNMLDARPVDAIAAPRADHALYLEIVFAADAGGVNRAYFNGITSPHAMAVPVPVLYGYLSGHAPAPTGALTPSTGARNAIAFDAAAHYYLPYGAVIDVLINNTDTGEHPIHFHGHVFWVLATSDHPGSESLYSHNWVRRDVVSVPAQGWAKIRLVSDNPGVWIAHCHIDWHMAAGLLITLVEAAPQLEASHITVPPAAAALCPAPATTGGGDGHHGHRALAAATMELSASLPPAVAVSALVLGGAAVVAGAALALRRAAARVRA